MLFSQRRDLHREVALWYEHAFVNDLSPFYSLLAHHWVQAEDPKRAVEYLEKAGRQALNNYANEEAVAFFEKALSLAKEQLEIDELQIAHWRLLLGGAYINLFKLAEGREPIESALSALGHPMPATTKAKSLGLLRQLWRQLLHRTWPKRYLGALAHDEQMVLITTSRAYEKLAEVYHSMNDTLGSLYAVFAILNSAESANCTAEMAFGYAGVGTLTGMLALHKIAEAYLQRALSTLGDVEDYSSKTMVNAVAGFYYAGVGNWTKATELLEEATGICDRLGDRRRWYDSAGNQMIALSLRGEFSQALELSDKIRESAKLYRNAHFEVVGLQEKAYCLMHQGAFEEASRALDMLLSIVEKNQQAASDQLMIEIAGLQAILHVRKRDYGKAIKAAEKVLNAARDARPSLYAALSGYSAAAEVYLALWEAGFETEGIDRLTKDACDVLHRYAQIFPVGKPRDLLWRGTYHQLSGRQARASKAWQQSLAEAERLGLEYDQGLAHYEIGRHEETGDSKRQRHLSQAVDIFAELGAAHARTLAENALKETRAYVRS
jgi:tetratricopeptide (TPR) repeat protein